MPFTLHRKGDMKFLALGSATAAGLVALLTWRTAVSDVDQSTHAAPAVVADNTCKCEAPPGEQVKCESTQLAICRVIKGKVYAECFTVPKNLADPRKVSELQAWTLSAVLQKEVSSKDIDKDDDGSLRRILKAERYEAEGQVVRFKLPTLDLPLDR